MTKIQKHIEIVCSADNRLSSMSKRSYEAILAVLERHYARVGVSIVNDLADLEFLIAKQPDLVFLGMKYLPGALPGTKVWISEFLDQAGISHTGSSQRAIEYELSKPLAKQRAHEAGIPTAPFVVIKKGQAITDEFVPLRYPLFVKPTNLGGGTGIDSSSLVTNLEELRQKVTSMTQQYSTDALVEEFLPGREFSVALLKELDSDILMAMPIELVAPTNDNGDPVLSQKVKQANEEVVIAVTDPAIKAQINSLATSAFRSLGARDYGRIDIRINSAGVAHFLEANLIPSLISGYGSFPKACVLNNAIDYETMILHIVSLGFDRDVADSNLVIDSLLEVPFLPTAVAVPTIA